jgi:hypothetical protein
VGTVLLQGLGDTIIIKKMQPPKRPLNGMYLASTCDNLIPDDGPLEEPPLRGVRYGSCGAPVQVDRRRWLGRAPMLYTPRHASSRLRSLMQS